MEDGELLEKVLAGDELAKARFVRRLEPVVRGAVRARLRRWSGGRIGERDADDLVQYVWMQLFAVDAARLRTWDVTNRSLESHAKVFAVWRLKELERKELRRMGLAGRPVSDDGAPEPVATDRPDELVEMRDTARALLRCVDAKFTTDLARRMVGLLLRERRSTDEIEAATGMNRQAVFRWRHRVLTRLRECWERIRDADA